MEPEKESNLESSPLTLEETLSRLEAEARLDSAVSRTADYLVAACLLDEDKSVLQDAVGALKKENPRELYLAFLKDTLSQLKVAEKPKQFRYAKHLNDVALAGLGIWQEDIGVTATGEQGLRISAEPRWDVIKQHIDNTVYGEYFIENYEIPTDVVLWGTEFPLRMSAADASQHRGKLRVPFNKTWATPVVVNNSAGVIKESDDQKPRWRNVAIPKDTKDYEDWVIIGPDDYAEMDEGDYEWAAKSSMDVGEFFLEETFLFKHGGMSTKPDVHFRDGRIFPQDKLMNSTIQNRHGQLTREAIYRMVTTARTARELKVLYGGVAKHVQLKVYSTLVNWYITVQMSKPHWNLTNQVLSDTELIRNLLCDKNFSAASFKSVMVTCPIVRRFETTSNLNRRTRTQVEVDLARLERVAHGRDLTAREIIDEALKMSVVMFFVGHTRTDELYIPRYEFVLHEGASTAETVKSNILKMLSALRLAKFDADEDHLWNLEEPIRTLVPMPILVAHDLSKRMGEELASNFTQRATAEFIKRLQAKKTSLS
jgi:hypothetical protein